MKSNAIRSWLAVACWILSIAPGFTQNKPVAQSVTFLDNKLWMLAPSGKVEVTNGVVFPGEIKINTNGVFTVKGGKERQLKSGQVLAPDGMLTSPDGSVVPVQNHLAALRGRVMLVKDGEAAPITSPYLMPDGSQIKPGGEILLPGGRIERMLDGQLIKLDGVSVPATSTASWKDGKVVLFKDGGRIVLQPTQTMMMDDGTKIAGDGRIIRSDGTVERLKPGEIFKIPGVASLKKY